MALLVTLVWVVMANRSTSHYWFSVGPVLVAICFLLAGTLLVCHQRPWLAVAVLGAGVLTYEGVAVLATLVVVMWVWKARRQRALHGAAMLAVLIAAVAVDWVQSPKLGTTPIFFGHARNWVSTLFGAGIFTTRAGVAIGSSVVLVAVVVALARVVVPGFAATPSQRVVLFGMAVSIGGLLPFLVVGFRVGTDGLFDRGNVVPDLGIAIVLGAILASAAAHLPRALGASAVGLAVVALAWPGGQSLKNYVHAAAVGRQLQAEFARDLPPLDQPLVVGPPVPYPGGVGVFITTWDTSGYLQLTHHDEGVRARMACSQADFADAREAIVYNRVRGTAVEHPSTAFGSVDCERMGL
jgi:hypothetical protein